MSDPSEFENDFFECFGDLDKVTLSAVNGKLRVELGGNGTFSERNKRAKEKSKAILDACFRNSSIWLRITLWDEEGLQRLQQAGIDFSMFNNHIALVDEEQVISMHLKDYNYDLIAPVVDAHINHEMAIEPSINITCYFVDFGKPVVVNIYDDRGADIYSPNELILSNIANEVIGLTYLD